MPEEVLFKFERRMSREEIADYLHSVADRIAAGGEFKLEAGDQSVQLHPPNQPTFEVKAERETSSSGESPEMSIEFELEWDEGQSDSDGTGELSIN